MYCKLFSSTYTIKSSLPLYTVYSVLNGGSCNKIWHCPMQIVFPFIIALINDKTFQKTYQEKLQEMSGGKEHVQFERIHRCRYWYISRVVRYNTAGLYNLSVSTCTPYLMTNIEGRLYSNVWKQNNITSLAEQYYLTGPNWQWGCQFGPLFNTEILNSYQQF